MKVKPVLLLIAGAVFCLKSPAQTLEEARAWLDAGKYEQAKPVFKKYLQSQPANGNYNLWYGICCLHTGDAAEAVQPLETAVKKRIPGGQLHLGKAYHAVYRMEDAVAVFETYVQELAKRKRPVDEAEKLLERSRNDLRMMKGVEEVCIVDSFVTDKDDFLKAYRLSEECGTIHRPEQFFSHKDTTNTDFVYETQIGNKIFYSVHDEEGRQTLCTSNKVDGEYSSSTPLPSAINAGEHNGYPFLLSDGVTLYYASTAGGLGGYDIFVTRYNTQTNTYLTPENIGMPFNSPANDYMYVLDEYNNLGWFASDRNQPEGKVCIYVFVPNRSKQTYDYDTTDKTLLARLGRIHSLKETWKDERVVRDALQRLAGAGNDKSEARQGAEFTFVVNDDATYHSLGDFRSEKARALFAGYLRMEEDCRVRQNELETLRLQYGRADEGKKKQMAPALIDLENRVQQMYEEIRELAMEIRRMELTSSQ